MRKLSMNSKILLMTFSIIAFSFFIAGIFLINNLLNEQEEDYGQRAMLIARTVANMPEIVDYLEIKNQQKAIQMINTRVEEVRVINKATYITVMDMARIRYSHPSKLLRGKKSTSEDINAAFSQHYYISKAQGEMGVMIRSFVPIIDEQMKQVGVVVVAYPMPTLSSFIADYKEEIALTALLSIVFSMWGATLLARHIKRRMFGLEPEEIAQLYVERQETFNAMDEGVIAVDQSMHITVFNEKAGRILGVEGKPENYLGQMIFDVLPDTRLPEIVETNKPIYNQELYINGHSILSTRIPIMMDEKNIGAVAIFKDLTEVKRLAEELTGVKAFVQALRVQTHEHKNKMHTIAGLMQLGHVEQALSYLQEVQATESELTQFLNERFRDKNISGLLLSKISRGKELGIKVEIDEESRLSRFPAHLDYHDFVILFGNLIENAFDALQGIERAEKIISISVDEHDGLLAILVSDNGAGIGEDVLPHVFENGFSTKDNENRGIGLYIVAEMVAKGNGTLELTSEKDTGTSFLIVFEMEEELDGTA